MAEDRLTVVGGTDAGDQFLPNPPHVPTDANRATVRARVTVGVSHRGIAAELGMSVNTLRKYYMREIMESDAKAQARLGQTAMQVAIGHPAEYDNNGNLIRAEQPPNVTMLIFQCKARLGWRDGGPGQIESGQVAEDNGLEFNTAGLTDAERSQRIAGLFLTAGARRARRPSDGAGAVGGVPEQPAIEGPGK